jgi:GT2 family glycosyltransferase
VEPLVRVVVLNHNGGELTLRCLESLEALDWPKERLEVVVVDNGSSDGSAGAVRERFPGVRVIEAGRNLGFAGGNNLGLRDPGDADYVALLNNDARVDPGWLAPLVAALEADPGLGAACPKILFAPSFAEITLAAPVFVPGRGDPRELGVRVSGVRANGEDRWREAQFGYGFYGEERGGAGEPVFRWACSKGTLRVPFESRADHVELRLAAEGKKEVIGRSGGAEVCLAVGPSPAWVELPLDGARVDVVQNAGSVLYEGGYAGDRGFLEVDRGQYDEPAEVFAWCGCSVLLRRRYLEEVGLLDDRLFLYYEDIDLAWRGRAQGWRYLYVPESRVRHVHTGTSVENSDLFQHYVERNRLLVHLKNAPLGYALRIAAGGAAPTIRYAGRDLVSPLLRGRRPSLGIFRRRLRSRLAFLRLAPAMLLERLRLRRRRSIPAGELLRWARPRP